MIDALLMLRTWLVATGRIHHRDDDRGASLVEYALLLALIALVCFVAVGFLGEDVSAKLDSTGNSLAN